MIMLGFLFCLMSLLANVSCCGTGSKISAVMASDFSSPSSVVSRNFLLWGDLHLSITSLLSDVSNELFGSVMSLSLPLSFFLFLPVLDFLESSFTVTSSGAATEKGHGH